MRHIGLWRLISFPQALQFRSNSRFMPLASHAGRSIPRSIALRVILAGGSACAPLRCRVPIVRRGRCSPPCRSPPVAACFDNVGRLAAGLPGMPGPLGSRHARMSRSDRGLHFPLGVVRVAEHLDWLAVDIKGAEVRPEARRTTMRPATPSGRLSSFGSAVSRPVRSAGHKFRSLSPTPREYRKAYQEPDHQVDGLDGGERRERVAQQRQHAVTILHDRAGQQDAERDAVLDIKRHER